MGAIPIVASTNFSESHNAFELEDALLGILIFRLPYDMIRLMRKRSWTETQLKKAVENSFSFRQVLAKLNLREAGGNYEQVKKYIKEFEIDMKHFKGRAWNAGMRGIGKPIIPLEKILVKDNYFQSFKLKKRLFAAGMKPRYCEECGWAKSTNDGYLPLELDHINGDRHDNRLENLRVLCPNCHSLKPTHRGRNRKRFVRVAK
ncbi:MAG: HNH endonuclease [Candidatus Liptonbacteria bacterium]|nr:HNH endonuclease [Candidatus Liptonbacteria bacterium]